MFIEKTNIYVEHNKMIEDLQKVVDLIGWPVKTDSNGKTLSSNQIGLTHRPGAKDQWLDNVGSLYDSTTGKFIATELDFTELNDQLGDYTRQKIEELCRTEKIRYGRIRYMRLYEKSGLTIHTDAEVRYHYALDTHPDAFICEAVREDGLSAKCYHIPSDGHFYKVDTTREHFVYNGGRQPRIHLVICAVTA